MTTVDGGIVLAAQALPGPAIRYAVRGTWSGGRWSPGSDVVVQHFRNQELVGLWKVMGVSLVSTAGSDPTLIVAPRASELGPLLDKNDIFVFGSGVYSRLEIEATTPTTKPMFAVSLLGTDLRGVFSSNDAEQSIVVFHAPTDTLDRRGVIQLQWRDKQFGAQLRDRAFASDEVNYELETYYASSSIPVDLLIRTMKPIRDFILDAGQELLYQIKRPSGGVRHQQTYQTFEPQMAFQPGSMRLLISPPLPPQMPLFVRPAEPIRLLVSLLRLAVAGNSEEMTRILLARVFSPNELLRKVLKLTTAAARYGDLQFRLPDSPSIVLTGAAATTVRKAIQSVKPRELSRTGTLYALDIYRRWCRVAVASDTGREDWTLRFDDLLVPEVEGIVPREVSIAFTTEARQDMKTAKGTLRTIKNDAGTSNT